VLHAISTASPAPVYGLFETYVGFGIAAGNMEFYADRGRLVGQLVRDAIAGSPSAPAPGLGVSSVPSRCVADARALLATFIEYAAVGKVTPIEWHQFIVEHYLDPQMEAARPECSRILGGSGLRGVTDEILNALRSLADKLRYGNLGAEE
jgi:hypothetical protein